MPAACGYTPFWAKETGGLNPLTGDLTQEVPRHPSSRAQAHEDQNVP